MAEFCVEKKTASIVPGRDWVLAFGQMKQSFVVASSEVMAIEKFSGMASRSVAPLRLVTWDGFGRNAKKRVVCTA